MFDKLNKEKSRYESGIILGYLMTGIAFVLYLPLGAAIGGAAFFLIAIPFLGGAVLAGRNHKKIKEMSNVFKNKYVFEEMRKIFPDGKYNALDGFTEGEVIESKILKERDRFKSEDLIMAAYDGVGFMCADVEQKEVRGSGKNRRVVTVFQGRLYKFDFPKKFKHDLLLLQPLNYRPFSNFNHVKTESIHFNSELKIYAQSEHEAFYILTPDFMEKLIYFDQKYYDKISFSFIDNHMYIAIDSRKDTFDIKAFKTINESMFKEYQDEFSDIIDFIKLLNLNDQYFKSSEGAKDEL
jgi:hypothetical protein